MPRLPVWMVWIVWIVSVLPIAVTLLPVVQTPKWWIRIWDYPRPQIAAALAATAAMQALTLPLTVPTAVLLAATAACIAWQLFRIHPYTRLAAVQVVDAVAADPAHTIGIFVANVLQENRDAAALLRRIEETNPDVVLAVETSEWWDGEMAGLRSRFAYAVRHPLENTYGMIVLSRLELVDVRLRERVTSGVPSVFARVRLDSGALVNLHCVHPEPPRPGNDVGERDAELLLVARDAARDRRPTIVCGDLNDVAWSHTTRLFQRISGLLDPRVGRGLYATFHAGHWFARWPLDHVFHDASFRLAGLAVLGPFGSDHFPVFVRLVHDPRAAGRPSTPRPQGDDRREASRKIADGLDPSAD